MASSNPTRPRPDELHPSAQADIDGPWDRESAEALTRAYEESEAEWRESRAARRAPPNDSGRIAPAQAADGAGSAWLESRVAEIAERLQRSIAGINPEKSAGALGHRIDELEERLASAFTDIAQRLDGHSLQGVEAQIGGLTAHLEHTRSQLERLDSIDERLRDLAGRLDAHQRLPEPARFSDSAIETLIEAAADRAAVRAVQSLPAQAASIDPQRIDALEGLMQEQIAERRRAEEMTSGVLRTIEESLGRILDRVDAMQPAGGASSHGAEADHAATHNDPLLEAYAQGARALGQSTPSSLLDAADYATNAPHIAVTAPERLSLPGWDDLGEEAQARLEQRAAAIRTRLATEAQTGVPSDLDEGDEPERSTFGGRGRIRPFAPTSGRRSSLLLILAMAALAGAGYLAVDIVLAQIEAPIAPERTTTLQPRATAVVVRAIPVAVSAKEMAATREEPIAPQDGARPADATAVLPEAIGPANLRQAAVNGDPQAQYEVGTRFADGKSVPQDLTQAFAWYQRAATRGFVAAQFRLAGLLERGTGVARDLERAKVWYRRAAENGHVKAMHNLAVLNARKDAHGDFVSAAKWFREAAEHGLTDSQYNLGLLYQKGMGVTKSLPESYMWFALASRGGDKEAAIRLEPIRAQLDPSELAAADIKLAVWRARPAAVAEGAELAMPAIDADARTGG
jgi:localization factor PodJL